MIFYKTAIIVASILLFTGFEAAAQRQTREEYVERYKHIAIDQMERYGIPASITMAQGILESDCGNSLLSRSSNNHFGIKCKRDWTGERVYHDDDEKGECFRAYPTVEASYDDHAEFLDKQPRYDSLFVYASDDYRSWARGLKACGYATAPDYAERLIRIIEESQLYLLDRAGGDQKWRNREHGNLPIVLPEEMKLAIDPDNKVVRVAEGYNIHETNGVPFVLANEGDTFRSLARTFRTSAGRLRKYNDITDRKAEPMPGEVVYLAAKKRSWSGPQTHHTARKGETAYAVGQAYGIRTSAIEKRNRLTEGEVIEAGRELKIK